MPRRGSADFVLSRCMGCTSETLLDKDWGIRQGSGSKQSRDLPLDGKKLLVRWLIKKNITRSGKKTMSYPELFFGITFNLLISIIIILYLKILIFVKEQLWGDSFTGHELVKTKKLIWNMTYSFSGKFCFSCSEKWKQSFLLIVESFCID